MVMCEPPPSPLLVPPSPLRSPRFLSKTWPTSTCSREWLAESETIVVMARSLLFCAAPNTGSLQFRMLAKRMQVSRRFDHVHTRRRHVVIQFLSSQCGSTRGRYYVCEHISATSSKPASKYPLQRSGVVASSCVGWCGLPCVCFSVLSSRKLCKCWV